MTRPRQLANSPTPARLYTSTRVAVAGEAHIAVARVGGLEVQAGRVLVAGVPFGAVVHPWKRIRITQN